MVLVHTPIHARWLNQVESYCALIQRKVLPPNDVADLAALRLRLAWYEALSNRRLKPFAGQFDRAQWIELMAKIEAHEKLLAQARQSDTRTEASKPCHHLWNGPLSALAR